MIDAPCLHPLQSIEPVVPRTEQAPVAAICAVCLQALPVAALSLCLHTDLWSTFGDPMGWCCACGRGVPPEGADRLLDSQP